MGTPHEEKVHAIARAIDEKIQEHARSLAEVYEKQTAEDFTFDRMLYNFLEDVEPHIHSYGKLIKEGPEVTCSA